MPWESNWVDPEIFLEHNGVTVYCTYKHDEISSGPYDNWFTMDPDYSESAGAYDKESNRGGCFDIRNLPGYKEVEKSRPPFIDTTNDGKTAQARKRALWEQWHVIEPTMKQDFLRGAIERGDLVPPGVDDA